MQSKYMNLLLGLSIVVLLQVCLIGLPWSSTIHFHNIIRSRAANYTAMSFFPLTNTSGRWNQSVSSDSAESAFLSALSSPSFAILSTRLSSTLPNCSYEIASNDGPVKVNKEKISMEQVEKILENRGIAKGGRWRPSDCNPLHRVAILIPLRGREDHLPIFLRHMHAFLQEQKLDYGIYVIEQTAKSEFNRAMLLNIGFVESNKQYDWQCYTLHDVDLLPEDSRNLYTCPWSNPRHLVVAHGGFGYSLVYGHYFGGVSELTRTQIEKINGFPNVFFGWGGEDDDIWNRVVHKGYSVVRYPADIGRYTPLQHKRAKPSADRFRYRATGKLRFTTDGLNSLKYKLQQTVFNKLFTRFVVKIDQNSVLK